MLTRNSDPGGEKIILRTRPRFLIHSKSVFIKLILLGLLIFLVDPIISWAVTIQSRLLDFVQIPLVNLTTMAMILLIFILILWAIGDLISWKFIEYILTDQRIIIKTGLINKKRSYIHYNKVQDIVIYQSLLERIFSSGDIEIYSGHENTTIVLENVPRPYQLEDKINRMIDKNLSYEELARKIEKEIKGEVEEEKYHQNRPFTRKKPIWERHSQKFKR